MTPGRAADGRLPFPVSVRPWGELTDDERHRFFAPDELPLHPNHAAQIGLLVQSDAARLADWAFAAIPTGWPDRAELGHQSHLALQGVRDAAGIAAVGRWLYDRGVPFRRAVYLLYDGPLVVRTTWKMVVRYWDAFEWQVGYAMLAVDHTLQWACCFHHEDVIVFGRRDTPG